MFRCMWLLPHSHLFVPSASIDEGLWCRVLLSQVVWSQHVLQYHPPSEKATISIRLAVPAREWLHQEWVWEPLTFVCDFPLIACDFGDQEREVLEYVGGEY